MQHALHLKIEKARLFILHFGTQYSFFFFFFFGALLPDQKKEDKQIIFFHCQEFINVGLFLRSFTDINFLQLQSIFLTFSILVTGKQPQLKQGQSTSLPSNSCCLIPTHLISSHKSISSYS